VYCEWTTTNRRFYVSQNVSLDKAEIILTGEYFVF